MSKLPRALVREDAGMSLSLKDRRGVGVVTFALGAIAAVMMLTNPAFARGAPDSFADLAERLLPSVVNISTKQQVKQQDESARPRSPLEDFFEQFGPRNRPRGPATSLGSGFIIDDSGLIVTNNHVIADADEITVILHDDTELEAELVGTDPKTDVAVLRVKTDHPLTAVPFGNSDKSRVGDWVVAIGNPMGLGGTVTAGIVSARGRDISSGPYDDYIQTDAPINRGNSGGPLFNMKGEVIGINTAIYSPNGGSIGIGFAIPSKQAERVVKQLREFGTTRRGWLGVSIQGVSGDIAESLGMDEAYGALVSEVHAGSPAGKAGMQVGDVIITFDGQRVPSNRRLPRMVANTTVGSEVPVEIWRDGRSQTVEVVLGELEKVDLASLRSGGPTTPETKDSAIDALGLSVVAITGDAIERFGLEADQEGVIIAEISDDSDAARKQLQVGDVIVEASQQKVSSPDDLQERIQKARSDNKKSILLLVKRNEETHFVALKFKQG